MTRPTDDRPDATLYARVRAYLAEWTGHEGSDPGIEMAELFGFLADALSAYQDQIGHEADLTWQRYVRVRLEEGRVVIDSDWSEGTAGKRYGVYRGVVFGTTDPLARGRLLVQVPSVSATAIWAAPCVPAQSSVAGVPAIGATVWIAYDEGDPDQPVWLGVLPEAP